MRTSLRFSRWWLVVVAAAVLGVAGTFQFTWSSVRLPLGGRIGAAEASLGTVFTVFVIFQTISQYPAGWVRDRYGPRIPLLVGSVLMAAGYAGIAFASAMPHAYLAYVIGGVGNGAVYTVAVNTPVKWFDERRGLATGIVSMSYAGLSFLLIPVLRRGLSVDFRLAALAMGGLAVVAGAVAIPILRDPERAIESTAPNESDAPTESGAPADQVPEDTYEWRETVRTWQFWVMYVVFVIVNGVGLMLIGKVVSLAAAMELPDAAGTLGASVVALADAVGIAAVAAVGDRLGRERTLGTSLVIAGVAFVGIVVAGAGNLTLGFVALVGAAAFFRSPAFSIFPTIVGEYYGTARSSENFALLYTAKLWGGVIGGAVASSLIVSLGWSTTFLAGGVLLVLAGVATFALRPV